MFIGPIFTREAVTAPRRPRHYLARGTYVAALLLMMCTAWLVLAGTQRIRIVGDLATFGAILFQILAPVQLALAVFLSALSCAAAVGQEKDRRTLILLLMTALTNHEVVLGKLFASLLNVLVLIVASFPLFMATILLGGVEVSQVLRVFAVTLLSAIVAGSLGSTVALWREKTFQALALTCLIIFFWLGGWEAVSRLPADLSFLNLSPQEWATAMSPWRAVLEATRPSLDADASWLRGPATLFLLVSLGAVVVLNLIAVLRIRVWNPTRGIRPGTQLSREQESLFSPDYSDEVSEATEEDTTPMPPRTSRPVWKNPVLWREVRTWAYGRKILVIRAAYWLLFVAAMLGLHSMETFGPGDALMIVVPYFLVGLVLVNAQGVTSLTSERDLKALDILMVTNIQPREFIFGKLGGILYNSKDMILLPLVLCGYLGWRGVIDAESLCFIAGGLLVMNLFVAMVGLHSGMIYEASRAAIGTSLGTVFFLFVGIATSIRILIAFSDSFHSQLAPFLAVMLGGGIGLYVALGARNASPAIFWASFICPFATFYAITSFLLGDTLAVFLVTVTTYGFATAAMLVPAIYAFDVVIGRTSSGGG